MNERSKAILRRLAASHIEQTRTEEARPSRYWIVCARFPVWPRQKGA
jgi:hypothetical protein